MRPVGHFDGPTISLCELTRKDEHLADVPEEMGYTSMLLEAATWTWIKGKLIHFSLLPLFLLFFLSVLFYKSVLLPKADVSKV